MRADPLMILKGINTERGKPCMSNSDDIFLRYGLTEDRLMNQVPLWESSEHYTELGLIKKKDWFLGVYAGESAMFATSLDAREVLELLYIYCEVFRQDERQVFQSLFEESAFVQRIFYCIRAGFASMQIGEYDSNEYPITRWLWDRLYSEEGMVQLYEIINLIDSKEDCEG